ncbi:SRPBCC family protein [Sutcliffiella halmapala]
MKNVTKMKIFRPVNVVFEAFVDPSKIGNYWFSSSSERWEQGKTVTLRYEEYDAQGDINIIEIKDNKKIVFRWGSNEEEHLVTISLHALDNATIVEVVEEGFNDNDDNLIRNIVDNKEGWVYMLTCLKGYLESGNNTLRAALVKG